MGGSEEVCQGDQNQVNIEMLHFPVKPHYQLRQITEIFPSFHNIYNVSSTKLKKETC